MRTKAEAFYEDLFKCSKCKKGSLWQVNTTDKSHVYKCRNCHSLFNLDYCIRIYLKSVTNNP